MNTIEELYEEIIKEKHLYDESKVSWKKHEQELKDKIMQITSERNSAKTKYLLQREELMELKRNYENVCKLYDIEVSKSKRNEFDAQSKFDLKNIDSQTSNSSIVVPNGISVSLKGSMTERESLRDKLSTLKINFGETKEGNSELNTSKVSTGKTKMPQVKPFTNVKKRGMFG